MPSRSRSTSVPVRLITFAGVVSGVVVAIACGSSSATGNGDGGADGSGGGGAGGSGGSGSQHDSGVTHLMTTPIVGPDSGPDAFFANDPPPMYCGFDGGMVPPTPTGTVECPSDKNREGCPCTTPGEHAACWPGLRVDRNIGQCKDGHTTCEPSGEGLANVWGKCNGYVLPEKGATSGSAACQCFSSGQWLINNLSPCFASMNQNSGPYYAVSTVPSDGGAAQCPNITGVPVPTPTQDWSTDSLMVDCPGHYKLCYTLKAGSGSNPQPNDCVVATICTNADYMVANKMQTIPPLGGWSSTDSACATRFHDMGGYGEMSVQGVSELCEKIDNGSGAPLVFNTVQYCPTACDGNPGGAGCTNCMQGGGGTFH